MRKYLLSTVALGSLCTGSVLAADFPVVAPAPVVVVPTWQGAYFGTQFGADCLNASHDSTTTVSSVTNKTEVVAYSPPPADVFNSTTVTTTTENDNSLATGQGKNCGARLALYGGYNAVFGRFLIGGQLEGGVANVRVNMTSSGSGTSSIVGTTTGIFGAPGATNTQTGTISNSSSFSSASIDTLDNRGQLSALGRIGVLIDPADLIYVIGGYTYGRFDYVNNFSFGMNGGTIGDGWEREIAHGWTMRIEGRYTKFASTNVTNTFSNTSKTSNSTATNFVGSFTGTDTVVSTTSGTTTVTDRFSGNVGSVLIGFSHYFGSY